MPHKKCSYIDYPFGEFPVCVKVRSRIFAQIYSNPADYKITLKCEPMFGDFYKNRYPGTVVRGYYCPPAQQPYWITIHMNGTVCEDELKIMIDHAYQAAVAKLPKKTQREMSDN